jgi:formate dehydrogenase beta subunit
MGVDRRSMLKCLTAAAAVSAVPQIATAAPRRGVPADAVGLLYDATLCIGCKACNVACKEANELPADVSTYGGGLYDAPDGLNEYSKSIIQLHRNGDEYAYVKKQCMHCVDPACVNACMLGALQKGKWGVVTWEDDRCVGCRYCQVACPFNVPKFEWASRAPKIVKCELCSHRLEEGKEPACSAVCPRGAVVYGTREELLAEARRRLVADGDGKYVQKIYGETELGGTQVLYLSHVPFEDLGFRFSDDESVPRLQRDVQHGIYQGFIAPAALYAALAIVMVRNRRRNGSEPEPPAEQK